jgi:hypothetical protein
MPDHHEPVWIDKPWSTLTAEEKAEVRDWLRKQPGGSEWMAEQRAKERLDPDEAVIRAAAGRDLA